LPPSFGDEVAERGWCTGAVVPQGMVPAIAQHLARPGAAPVEVAEADWLTVVSQTCDVLAAKLEAEPLVEILHCRPIPKLRKGTKELRSTRMLDFKPNRETHGDLCLTAHAVADRYTVPREFLRDHAPDAARHLSDVATARVLAWYALRYGRPIWPDAFVNRISGAKDALEAALEPLKDDIAEVRVSIAESDDELDEGESYHLAVFFVVDEEVWNGDVDGREVIHAAFAKFTGELDGCDGIEVDKDNSDVVSGGAFTWQETRATEEWNFANLSYRE
jgi:hypothetical protein